MAIKVRKGLCTPLKIMGMSQRYFYLWAIGSGACLLFLGLLFNSFIKEGVGGFIKFISLVLVLALISLGVKVYLTSLSSKKRLSFSREAQTLSNKDLLKIRINR